MAPCAAWRPNLLDRKNGQSCCENAGLGKLPRRLGGLCKRVMQALCTSCEIALCLAGLRLVVVMLGAVIDRSLSRIRICVLVMP